MTQFCDQFREKGFKIFGFRRISRDKNYLFIEDKYWELKINGSGIALDVHNMSESNWFGQHFVKGVCLYLKFDPKPNDCTTYLYEVSLNNL